MPRPVARGPGDRYCGGGAVRGGGDHGQDDGGRREEQPLPGVPTRGRRALDHPADLGSGEPGLAGQLHVLDPLVLRARR